MKPFTNYSCTGLIKNNNVFINKTTPPVHFNIDCDFTIKDLKTSSTTNTSIELNWETTSEKCQDILHKLEKLTYSCSCQDAERNYHTVGSAVMISHFHLILIIIVIVQNVTFFICRGRASRRNKPPPKHRDKETH
ncbi:uncharacterized protein V3H82_008843 [Fundulus diaphanus]